MNTPDDVYSMTIPNLMANLQVGPDHHVSGFPTRFNDDTGNLECGVEVPGVGYVLAEVQLGSELYGVMSQYVDYLKFLTDNEIDQEVYSFGNYLVEQVEG